MHTDRTCNLLILLALLSNCKLHGSLPGLKQRIKTKTLLTPTTQVQPKSTPNKINETSQLQSNTTKQNLQKDLKKSPNPSAVQLLGKDSQSSVLTIPKATEEGALGTLPKSFVLSWRLQPRKSNFRGNVMLINVRLQHGDIGFNADLAPHKVIKARR